MVSPFDRSDEWGTDNRQGSWAELLLSQFSFRIAVRCRVDVVGLQQVFVDHFEYCLLVLRVCGGDSLVGV